MVSKATNEKLKQGIAVRFHGEEGMVSGRGEAARPTVCAGGHQRLLSCLRRARAWCGNGLISSPTRSSIQTMLSSPSQQMVPHAFLFWPP